MYYEDVNELKEIRYNSQYVSDLRETVVSNLLCAPQKEKIKA